MNLPLPRSLVSSLSSCVATTCALALVSLHVGCGSAPAPLKPPSFNPTSAARAAIKQYDRNGDHQLQPDEWSACPSIAGSIDIYDTNGDQILTEDELAAGIRRWQEGSMGARPLPFQIRFAGRPLEGASVHLVPEDFFNGAIMPATGKSAQGGRGFLGVAPEDLPGDAPELPLVQPGLYRVEITHPSIDIPEKYNTQTTLGLEVAEDKIDPRGVTWNLTP